MFERWLFPYFVFFLSRLYFLSYCLPFSVLLINFHVVEIAEE